ncbi:MAG: pyruvate dehydrogenase complex dihydrolipoamide acetyltransferase [Microscillaceae bacterium]|nr:pyruvate dehydrogenase complex dihydrolipoamide acetyltransferase [Microscillaceae bacterium]
MAVKILMPKMSDTMEEGVIAAWHVKVGDKLEGGMLLAEIETDKATMEREAYDEETGTVLYLVDEGSTIPVDQLIAIVGNPGEDFQALLGGGSTSAMPSTPPSSSPTPTSTPNPTPSPAPSTATQTVTQATAAIPATIVLMPKMSDTMEEGTIAEWHKKIGDSVEPGELLVEIETDKATMEREAYDEEKGTLLYVAAQKGETIQVDDILCIIGEPGADYQALIQQFKGGGLATPDPASSATQATPTPTPESVSTSNQDSNGRIKISPLAKKIAQEKGFDLSQIQGSGDGGRIIKKDIETFVPAAKTVATPAAKTETKTEKKDSPKTTAATASPTLGQESYDDVPLSQMRKTIARRLAESKFSAPHFYLTMEIVMDEAMETRQRLNEISPVKISFNDMVIKAAAVALRQHPAVNAAWMGDKIRYNKHIHVGMAVAVPEGLLVPVIRFADMKSLSQIAGESKDLAGKAKDKKLQPADWEGNTFSVSNLGMFGIEEFTAIINPPDSCIMAIGTIKQIVVPDEKGGFKVSHVMKVTLSCDHRVVDGASGAAFLKTFKELLESPIRMLV